MFKLQRLELSGFKSFVDPVSLQFAGGLTAIVGPNGCGKSNLVDAVMWVIGERSAKNLRGATMEDVIFNGSEGRRPLGSAEVTLTLETDPAFALAQEGVLTLGRRVFRSGESEYRINGKRARLKEIKDLLMDTGLGFRAYSVIEQGRIGMILSGKPQERRKLIEEAAGVTRYRERRRLAEIKLEEARANLERLDDILAEVERTMRSLKRQAGAAQRYRQREQRYRELLRRVLLARWSRLGGRLAELAAELAAATASDAELTARLARGEAELAAAREATDELARDLAERHRRQAQLAATIEGRQQFLAGSHHRLAEIAERLAAGRLLAVRRQEEVARHEEARGELAAQEEELAAERRRAASDMRREEERIREVVRSCTAAEARLESLRAQLLASLGGLSSLRNRLHQQQVESEKGKLRQRQLATERERKERELAEAQVGAAAAAGRVAEVGARSGGAEERLGALRLELERLAARDVELVEARHQVSGELAMALQRRRLLLEASAAQHERRALLVEALAQVEAEAPRFLADQLEVPEGWERSLDFYLGELADAIVLPAGADTLALARSLAAGRGTVRLLEPQAASPETAGLADPAIVCTLAEALRLPDELARALPQAYLVEATADARRLAQLHPGIAFIAHDRQWALSGILHVQGEQSEPGALARDSELADLADRVPELEARFAAIEREIAELGLARRDQEAATRDAEGELDRLRQELAVARARLEDVEGRRRRLALELETLTTETEEIERELGRVVDGTTSAAHQLAQAESRHGGLETAFDAAQKAVEAARAQREQARTAGVDRRGHLRLLEARAEAQRRDGERLERAMAEARRQDETWSGEVDTLNRRQAEIEAAVGTAESELQRALEEREEAEAGVAERQAELAERRRALAESEAEIRRLRQSHDAERNRVGELRVAEAGARQDAEHLAGQYRESFAGAALPARPEPLEVDLAELEGQLSRAKEGLEQIGPVNLLAAEEHAEQEERLRFLSAQHADVAASVDSLRRTIKEINQTSSERFLETFRQANEIFGQLFQELFRGGEAAMHLQDDEDLLECGIEIVARPPGKRLQNLMLLSGGEKALTAVALLFALFRIKPSPFCLLDEVDAPLDDVNTLRFVEMVRRMASETQFVVITHNKLTMEAAAVLYGVTMQERGVSKVVSVELAEMPPAERVASA